VRIYPDFAVGDARLTERITMRDLVCNCTGITRRDIELFFPSRPRTAAEMIRALRTYPSAGTFRRTYQYNNQMVAAGGYIAARAAGGGTGDLAAGYVAQMRRLVFDPIGMTSTTFSLEAVLADPDHATPHGRTADLRLTPIPLELERLLQPLIPSGGSWSNARDLARYLITQLNRGVAPDGRRVVSAANLEETWRPQVPVSPQASYALGWAAGAYKGARLLNHSGETNGFTADLTMLPDAGLGVAVLSNAQRDRHFVSAVRTRVLELAFGQPMEADALYARRAEQERQAAEQQLGRVQPRLDPEVATVYPGVYTNPALGEVSLAVEVGGLLANVVQAGVPDRLIGQLRTIHGGHPSFYDSRRSGRSATCGFADGRFWRLKK
jgi:CubicO group peptidase (beta-lactamase class C family)